MKLLYQFHACMHAILALIPGCVHACYTSLDSRLRRERQPGILCMRTREIIDSNFIIQIVKKRTKLQKGRIRMTMGLLIHQGYRCYRKGMMCSCGSPEEAVVIWTMQASLLLPNLAFMFDKKSLLKIKKLMIISESF